MSQNPYCERLRARFDDVHDGETSPWLRAIVGRHLAACQGCRAEYELLERAIRAVRNRPAPDVPPRLLRKVVEQFSGPRGGATFPGFGPGLTQGLEPL